MEAEIIKIISSSLGLIGLVVLIFYLLYKQIIKKAIISKLGEKSSYKILIIFLILIFAFCFLVFTIWLLYDFKSKELDKTKGENNSSVRNISVIQEKKIYTDSDLFIHKNIRFDFEIKLPKMWDLHYPPINGDGISISDPDKDGVEIRAYGVEHFNLGLKDGESFVDVGHFAFDDYVDRYKISLIENYNATIIDNAESILENINRKDKKYYLVGRRIEYTFLEDNIQYKAFNYIYSEGFRAFHVICSTRVDDFENYRDLFYLVGKNFKYVGMM